MVVMKDGVNESSLKRRRQHDFPTPESPMRRSFIWFDCKLFVEEMGFEDGIRAKDGTYEKVIVSCTGHDCTEG